MWFDSGSDLDLDLLPVVFLGHCLGITDCFLFFSWVYGVGVVCVVVGVGVGVVGSRLLNDVLRGRLGCASLLLLLLSCVCFVLVLPPGVTVSNCCCCCDRCCCRK